MTVNGFTSDTSFRAAECAVLDKMDVYGSKGNLNNLYYTKGYGLEMIIFGVLVDWLITQKVFLGSGTEKNLYMPSEKALKMLSFDSNFICIGSRGGAREQI